MAESAEEKPDFGAGYPVRDIADGGMVQGTAGGEDVVLARRGEEYFAVGAHCTHYHGPLADGILVDDTVRCPWHHACFSLRTGEAIRAPALDAITCWRVQVEGERVFVREKLAPAAARSPVRPAPESIVIVGGGAAGLAAADMLRREGYDGPLTMISADASPPVDRPNLSKDYLAGTAQEEWIPLRAAEFYAERRIDLLLNARVTSLDLRQKRVSLADGGSREYSSLLLATGADPVQLAIPGAAAGQVFHLRTFSDSKAIVARAASAKRVLVIGASFIGLEVAASLRARELEVHVVAPEEVPLVRVMGAEVGGFIRRVHEDHGVFFHLGLTVARVDGTSVTLSDGSAVEADFIVAGVGVRPVIDFAEKAGLSVDRGLMVNEYLETSEPGVFAAGDIARWPDPHTGERIRVEHWVVAERQGQVAARNMLGRRERFDAVPFFWSQHYDVAINYVGHAERWDAVVIDGSLEARECVVHFKRGDRTLAVATVGRDRASLQAERVMEVGAATGGGRRGA
jgi:NADPH-dependent 2,4-dienoyl-CoA reductase/sulfur reductase-like enzyme/nitrite reductase/ring-hydroxylating ferredoxin subunit